MHKLAILQFVDGRLQAQPTDKSFEDTEITKKAVESAGEASKVLRDRYDKRRQAFMAWAAANPRELDLLLDEAHKYGTLFEQEYADVDSRVLGRASATEAWIESNRPYEED